MILIHSIPALATAIVATAYANQYFKVIEEAEDDDRLNLKIRMEGKPKVLEATRIQSPEDIAIAMDATEPFDSEDDSREQ